VELSAWERLRSAEGSAALVTAAGLVDDDPLAGADAMRAAGFDPELAAGALTQARLRRRAEAKFGPDAGRLFFTRPGLEQATRSVVADRRAARLVAAGVFRIADLGCGIGADTIALARAGLRVLAVEADPATAAIAQSNVDALGLPATVVCADATDVDLSDVDAVFCDPARRDTVRAGRVFDPKAYSPPWSFVVGLADRIAATVIKSAPGLDHANIPAGAEAEWVSVDHDLVECALWFGPLATVPRRASLLTGGTGVELTGSGVAQARLGPVGRYLTDPDPAIVRAYLLAEFVESVDGVLADPHIAYVFTDRPTSGPYGHCFEIIEALPFALKQLRAALRERGVGKLEILKRGLAVDPARLRRELRLTGPHSASLILARLGGRPVALLGQSCA
jgi:SAM-dependent methyltransferase